MVKMFKPRPGMKVDLPDLSDNTLTGLVKIYNSLVAKHKQIKKFKDRKTAIRRITEQFMLEKANRNPQLPEISDEDRAKFREAYAKKQAKGEPTVAIKLESLAKKVLHCDIQVTKSLSEGNGMFKISLMGKKSKNSGKFLYKNPEHKNKNPRRAGSHGYFSWEKYEEGMTLEQLLVKGCRIRDINDDLNAGRIVFEKKQRKE